MFIGELVSITNAEDVDLGLWARKELLGYLLDKVPQRMSVYNSIVIRTRQALADILSSESLWEEAANTLQDIRPDQWPSSADASEKFDVYIKTMDLFLHANNLSQAAFTLNRATSLVHSIKDNELRLKYRYLQASILDQSQKYIEAVNGYRNVLAHSKPGNTEEQRMLLNKAIRCAVLASAGPQKVRTVANMYRVTEAASCDCFPLLEMMFLQRIIKPSVAEQFSQFLEAHQLQTAADGHSTLFEYAIREHNVSVLSSLYTNIKLENLGHMLGTNSEGAEIVCARMISESRLKGHIDQIAGLITFEGAREVKEVSAAILLKKQASMQPPLMHLREQVSAKWDERIVSLCTTVEDAVDLLIQRQPGYARMMFRNDMK
ncbi:COP9 signalosome complex subunit 4 [Coemansia sp. RSA 1933]|nr:COP9 signalosome complex subunit 4 [Coemansia sp. RSA 1933]